MLRHFQPKPTRQTQPVGQHRWSLHAVAAAVALTAGLTSADAWALALGRVTVQSLLGEPLRAEIDLPSVSAEEASSLQIGMATPERFTAASMTYHPALSEVSFELTQRPDGRHVVRLRGTRVLNEPFLDLVVQAQWANGQVLRGYTLLFDPPNLKPATAAAPLLPATSAPSATATTAVRPLAPATSAPVSAPKVARPATPARPAQGVAAAEPTRVPVARGDTAGRIAAQHKPASASLEQMLIGLLRANPHAFVGHNVNRLKAGVVLDLPDETTVTAIHPTEARQMIATQSRDFNDYRRRLAAAAGTEATPTASRASAGQVQAEVTETRSTEPTPDKLTLSKAGEAATSTPEAQVAQERQREASQQRAGELSRNLEELEQLKAQTAPEGTAAPATPTAPESGSGPSVAATPPSPPAATPAATPAPTPAPAAPPPATPAPPPATSWLDDLLAQPWALPAAGGLAALLALLALLQVRKRRAAALPHDAEESTFDDAEGQSVDTSEAGPVSSMMYSPSQLDAGGDVDPVAEADVYLAYGRDQQAEEILLEALRLHPDRLPVRAKLLELYAQRNDVATYNLAAQELYDLTFGEGPEWAQARDTGLQLDPDNPLYQGSSASVAQPTEANDAAWAPDASSQARADVPATPAAAMPDVDFDLDLTATDTAPPTAEAENPDLDFDLSLPAADDEPSDSAPVDVPVAVAEAPSVAASEPDVPSFDFDLSTPHAAPSPTVTEAPTPATTASTTDLDPGLDFDFDISQPAADDDSVPDLTVAAPNELPEEIRDLSLDLDLDLETPAPEVSAIEVTEPALDEFADLANLEVDEGGNADPLETKLSLAREFEAIGDADGARSLAEEVEAEASGDLQARARAFLAQLS